VTPDYDFETAPPADVLLVPGGNIDEIVQSPANKAWLVKRARESEIVLSTCTGAFVLGYAGLLDGLPATTIAPQIKYLKQEFPRITQAVRDRRVVDTGKIITTAGLSAGMDGALHVLERWYGRFDAVEVARGIEYDWHPDRPGSYGELVQHQMPHWPAIVPAGSAWARYHESGDNRRWETRAHVGFGGTPQAYLDHLGSQVLKEGWASAGRRHLSSTFRRSAEGAKWAMTLSLDETHAPDRHDLVVRVTRLGK